jgi:hypothetical protein
MNLASQQSFFVTGQFKNNNLWSPWADYKATLGGNRGARRACDAQLIIILVMLNSSLF